MAMTPQPSVQSMGVSWRLMTTPIHVIVFIAAFAVIVLPSHAQNIELTYRIEEELAPMSAIGHIVQDSNIAEFVAPEDIGDLRFSFLTQGNPYISYVWINSTTGELRTFSRIDRETLCRPLITSCQFRVEAAVQAQIGTFFNVVVINIEIIDINDNSPAFDPPTFNLLVSEDDSVGARFRLPSASDPDTVPAFSVVAYSLSNLNSVPGMDTYFSLTVDGQSSSDFSVHLRLDKDLDREVTSSYSFLLEAKDGGNPSLTGSLTVNVEITDVNDNSPLFDRANYVANISEITAVNKDVLKVRATDRDSGVNAALVYSLPLAQEDPTVFSMFAINESNGQIKTKIPLDTYAGGSYSFLVEARDSGVTPLTATTEVTIHIKDTHNSYPEILLNVFGTTGMAQVSEMAELGRTVAYVAVSDPDSSLTPNGIVTCSVDSGQFELQAIDVDKYKVILTRRLDRERAALHSVTVLCDDSGSPPLNSSASFVVQVEDENDNAPVFDSSLYVIEVQEGPRGTDRDTIVQVHATDGDTGPNADVTYRLADVGSDPDFGIYADGSIVVTNPDGLDREEPVKGQIRELVVLAVDGGKTALTGTARVKVTITDINDNAPQFSEPTYYFSVLENSQIGTVVNNVTASDADTAANGLFYFKMDPADESSVPFRVSAEGAISVSDPLDREMVPKFRFRVIAYDIGQPALLTSSVTVNMHIKDVNDNRPTFTFPNDYNRTVHIPHTLSINTGFGHINAIDLDIGKNGELRYSRDSGNGTKYVDILPDTGEIVLIRSLTMKDLGPHYLTVAVHDLGSREQLATQAVLQIVIYEGNATVAVKDESKGFRNVVVVVVLVVVTVSLGLAILLTIVLIQRVDKQRRRYHAKEEEAKVDSNLRHLNPVLGMEVMESATDLSDVTSRDPKADGARKKKEVSFSLDEDNNVSQSSGSGMLTSFGAGLASDKYDVIPERERGKIKGDMLLISNHNHMLPKDDPRGHQKMSKKDMNTLTTFHQVQPSSSSGAGYSARQDQPSHHHDDNLSDVSADVSTSDSGRGGSDVELQSHGGISKDSGDPSFLPHPTNQHNNLNAGGASRNGNSSSSNNNNSNMSRNISNSNSNLNYSARNLGNKSVHFQNIRPEPLSSFRSSSSSAPSHPPRSQRPLHNAPYTTPPTQRPLHNAYNQNYSPNSHQNAPNRYTPNSYASNDDEGSYVKLANRSGRSSNPTNQDLDNTFRDHSSRHDNGLSPAPFPSTSSRYTPTTFFPSAEDVEYMDMAGARSSGRGAFMHQRTGSNPVLEGATTASSGWDGDTTTSGSYTVDPQELCDEIDKLFFEETQDVVV